MPAGVFVVSALLFRARRSPAVRPPFARRGAREGSLPRMCRGSAPGGGVEEHHAASTHFGEATLLRGPSLMPYS